MAFWHAPDIKFKEESVVEYNQSMMRYAAMLGKTIDETLIQWAGRAAEEFMRETPPFVNKSASNTPEAKRRGEIAAKNALMKSVIPSKMFFDKPFTNKNFEKIVKRKSYTKWRDTVQYMPEMQNYDAKPFNEQMHLDNRPPGRFEKIKQQKLITFDDNKWNNYLKKLQSRVGWMKSGWGVAVQKLGRKVPPWIARHLPYARGSCKIDLASDNKLITLTNTTPTVSRFGSRYSYALEQLSRRMLKQMQYILDSEKKKLQK